MVQLLPSSLTGQGIKGFAPNIYATPRRGCETLITAGLAKRKKRTVGSTDVRVGCPCWTIPLRTLSSEPDFHLQRQHRKSQDHQRQAEGLGMKLSFPMCKMGTDRAACLLLGLGQGQWDGAPALTQLLDHAHPKGVKLCPSQASPLPDTARPSVSLAHCWGPWVLLGI